MTAGLALPGFQAADTILAELPVAVMVVTLDGAVLECNHRARALLGLEDWVSEPARLAPWTPRSTTLTQALQNVAGSSNWSPIALHSGDKRVELKGRGMRLEEGTAPRVVLMETHSAPHRFAEHSKQVRQLNAQLAIQRQTEEKLKAALRAAESLRRELVHRVKNNLAIVSALLRTKARVAEHPAAAEALVAAATRVRSIAIVHEILDARNETDVLTSTAMFSALLDQLQTAICPPSVTLQSDVFDTELHTDTALPLCLLVNELVTNAIKHAFPGRESGVIQVTFAETEGRYVLTVADNGSATEADPAAPKSGSRIIQALAQQLDGQVSVSRTSGTTWSMTLAPVRRPEGAFPRPDLAM